MKNILLFLLSIILISTKADAQGDYFAPLGAEWCFGSIPSSNYPQYSRYHYSKYYSEKDTVIIEQDCRKITGYSIYRDGTREDWPPLFVYSTPDTVYRYNDSFSLFVPMYIFNVSEGDTLTYHVSIKLTYLGIPGSSWSDSLFQVVVTKVDSVHVDGIYLRQVWTQPVENWGFIDSYIERIGSTYNILGNIFLGSIPEAYHTAALRSYQDSAIFYKYNKYGEYDCEYFPTAINEKTKPEKILIYPNPTNGHFTINTRLDYPDQGQINITDLSGRVIHQLLIPKEKQETYEFPMQLPAGIYILQWILNGKLYAQKLVIQP